jgi:hypothetical protein
MRLALANRSRVARHGGKPSESVVRAYDRDGKVILELARTSDGWSPRASTLPADIVARPLASFLATGGARLATGRVLVGTNVSSDTFPDHVSISTDSAWVDSTALTQEPQKDSDDGLWGMNATFYFSSLAELDTLEYADAAYVIAANPDPGHLDNGWFEWSVDGADYPDLLDSIGTAVWPALRAFRNHTSGPSTFEGRPVDPLPILGVFRTTTNAGCASSISVGLRLPAWCKKEIFRAMKWSVIAAAAGAACAAAVELTGPLATILAKVPCAGAAGAGLAYTSALFDLTCCLLNGGQACDQEIRTAAAIDASRRGSTLLKTNGHAPPTAFVL